MGQEGQFSPMPPHAILMGPMSAGTSTSGAAGATIGGEREKVALHQQGSLLSGVSMASSLHSGNTLKAILFPQENDACVFLVKCV